jgi:hypothetical protein
MNSTSSLVRPYRPVALRDPDGAGDPVPTAPEGDWDGALIDYNIRAERMGWLPSAPQLRTNPLEIGKAAKAAGRSRRTTSPSG